MNSFTLNQKSSVGFNKGVKAIAKVQRKNGNINSQRKYFGETD